MVSQTSVNDETKRRAFKSASKVGEKKKKELLHTTTANGEKKTFEQRAFDVDILRLLFFLFLYTRRAPDFLYTRSTE